MGSSQRWPRGFGATASSVLGCAGLPVEVSLGIAWHTLSPQPPRRLNQRRLADGRIAHRGPWVGMAEEALDDTSRCTTFAEPGSEGRSQRVEAETTSPSVVVVQPGDVLLRDVPEGLP